MIGAAFTLLLAAAEVQSPPPPPSQQVSAEHQPANLDRLLAAKEYVPLGQIIANVSQPADLMSDLDWLKARMMEGDSAFITMLYARSLWVAANGYPEPARSGLRQSAAMATLFARSAMALDGARCGDRSAPSHRLDQLAAWNPEVWPYIGSLPEAEREKVVTLAVALEAHTAAARTRSGDVEFLCRGGLEETQYNLQHGSAREVPTPAGQVGRTIELSGDGKYKPSERPETEWRAEADKARASLRSDLSAFVAAIGGAGPVATPPK